MCLWGVCSLWVFFFSIYLCYLSTFQELRNGASCRGNQNHCLVDSTCGVGDICSEYRDTSYQPMPAWPCNCRHSHSRHYILKRVSVKGTKEQHIHSHARTCAHTDTYAGRYTQLGKSKTLKSNFSQVEAYFISRPKLLSVWLILQRKNPRISLTSVKSNMFSPFQTRISRSQVFQGFFHWCIIPAAGHLQALQLSILLTSRITSHGTA